MNEILNKLADIQASQREMNVTLQNQKEILIKHTEILHEQQTTLIRNTLTVEEHHRRSLALERMQNRLEAEIEPIKDHVTSIQAVLSFIKWIGIASGVVLSLLGIATAISKMMG